ncbi:hypothetical protein Xcel_2610 [Xylanimonas cellulosilytica DSM 15894]|uniref:DUF2505 domain-containing protein n=1 Tax=Xylanimonas cellulosilytica (strain DSM 15894 / JCM 12276 / CECT 5975 / KCTC 9989 / LMG 20990 / NBRC 107835 / XIL07) TaxID=446471 RepID=D1BX56_XYLCX|nr:DUF2505 domain-containing protein [Xylanimonas cellulosilytica]ACZ31624.1 hypothetical protein Xcel_2610 [Xylanimonas cellulosilytica DSM 15894]
MRLTVELTYPASVDVVAAMLADEEFVRWRAARSTGSGEVEQADLTGSVGEGFTAVVRRTLATDQIPAQVRPFVGDRLEVRQAEVWEAPRGEHVVGTVALEIAGAPVRVTGTVRLEPAPDGGTRQVYYGEVKASVPLFGGVVEEAAARAVRATLLAEGEAGVEWLAGAGRP